MADFLFLFLAKLIQLILMFLNLNLNYIFHFIFWINKVIWKLFCVNIGIFVLYMQQLKYFLRIIYPLFKNKVYLYLPLKRNIYLFPLKVNKNAIFLINRKMKNIFFCCKSFFILLFTPFNHVSIKKQARIFYIL